MNTDPDYFRHLSGLVKFQDQDYKSMIILPVGGRPKVLSHGAETNIPLIEDYKLMTLLKMTDKYGCEFLIVILKEN